MKLIPQSSILVLPWLLPPYIHFHPYFVQSDSCCDGLTSRIDELAGRASELSNTSSQIREEFSKGKYMRTYDIRMAEKVEVLCTVNSH